MLINLWVKDTRSGEVHQVGTDEHDSLQLIDGNVEYYNLQNGEGTGDGEYEFVETPDMDDYKSVTPDELWINRELAHKDIRKIIKKHERKQKLLKMLKKIAQRRFVLCLHCKHLDPSNPRSLCYGCHKKDRWQPRG